MERGSKISIVAGGEKVDPSSTFRLSFMGEPTNEILALPFGGSSCLGSTLAKQILTSTTENTSGEGGNSSVSPLTFFSLSYRSHKISNITANSGSCSKQALLIEKELELLPGLYDVIVSGSNSNKNDMGCVWIITFIFVKVVSHLSLILLSQVVR